MSSLHMFVISSSASVVSQSDDSQRRDSFSVILRLPGPRRRHPGLLLPPFNLEITVGACMRNTRFANAHACTGERASERACMRTASLLT